MHWTILVALVKGLLQGRCKERHIAEVYSNDACESDVVLFAVPHFGGTLLFAVLGASENNGSLSKLEQDDGSCSSRRD